MSNIQSIKTYVVYMSNDAFSVEMTKDTIKSLEKFNIEYEMFDGVVGRNGVNVLESFGVKPSAHVAKAQWTDGTIGCLASHYLLWDKCADQEEPFLILEQDGVLIRDPGEIADQVEFVCHLDAFLPFNNSNKNLDYNHFEEYNKSMSVYVPGVSKHPENKFYGSNKITGAVFRGTYGYIITPKGAKAVINFISNHGAFPSDQSLCKRAMPLQRANSTYVRLNPFFKNLEIQKEFSSR